MRKKKGRLEGGRVIKEVFQTVTDTQDSVTERERGAKWRSGEWRW